MQEKYLFYALVLKTISPVITFVIGWLMKSPLKPKPKDEEIK